MILVYWTKIYDLSFLKVDFYSLNLPVLYSVVYSVAYSYTIVNRFLIERVLFHFLTFSFSVFG